MYKDVPPSFYPLPHLYHIYESRLRYLFIYSYTAGGTEVISLRHINCFIIIITLPQIPCLPSHEERKRGHSMKLFYPTVNYLTRHNFFTIRISNPWNEFPEVLFL